jgi:hypothetical protein
MASLLQLWRLIPKEIPLMEMKNEIKRLARMEESPHPFCSLYLNTKWDDSFVPEESTEEGQRPDEGLGLP